MTNREKINQMSDADLADWLMGFNDSSTGDMQIYEESFHLSTELVFLMKDAYLDLPIACPEAIEHWLCCEYGS